MRTVVSPGRIRVLWTVLVAGVLAVEPVLAQARVAGRILGVFDELSFQPIAGAEVVDLGTGIKAVTTETGTISLGHLSAGTTMLHVRRIGYESKIVPVTVAPTDTVSITVVLAPLMPTLPAVVRNRWGPSRWVMLTARPWSSGSSGRQPAWTRTVRPTSSSMPRTTS